MSPRRRQVFSLCIYPSFNLSLIFLLITPFWPSSPPPAPFFFLLLCSPKSAQLFLSCANKRDIKFHALWRYLIWLKRVEMKQPGPSPGKFQLGLEWLHRIGGGEAVQDGTRVENWAPSLCDGLAQTPGKLYTLFIWPRFLYAHIILKTTSVGRGVGIKGSFLPPTMPKLFELMYAAQGSQPEREKCKLSRVTHWRSLMPPMISDTLRLPCGQTYTSTQSHTQRK